VKQCGFPPFAKAAKDGAPTAWRVKENVPVAILATLLHAEWQWLLNLFMSIIIIFGTRALGIWLTTPSRRYQEPLFEENIVIEAEKGAGQ
jgi:hypothetical protein